MTISNFDKGIKGGADDVTGDKMAGKGAEYIMTNSKQSTARDATDEVNFNDILGVTNNLKENGPHEMVDNGVLGGNVPKKS